MIIELVNIAVQMIVVGSGMECIVIMIGYIIQAVFGLLKGR